MYFFFFFFFFFSSRRRHTRWPRDWSSDVCSSDLDAGDTLIRLSGTGEKLLHRAAANLGVDELDPEEVAEVWRRVLNRSSTAEELAKGRDLSNDRHREVWTALYHAAGCDRLDPGLSEELYGLTVRAEYWGAGAD